MNIVQSYDLLRFARGYLVAPRELHVEHEVLRHWKRNEYGGFVLYSHPESDLRTRESEGGDVWVLLGNAFDPWNGLHDEGDVLEELDAGYRRGEEDFFGVLDRLTGRFVLFYFRGDGTGFAVQDAVGLKNLFYAESPFGPCFASHSQLLADVLRLPRDPDIDRLVRSYFYGIGIRHLPGLRTPFRGMRMLSANTLLRLPDLRVERFFPRGPYPESEDLQTTAKIIGDIFARSFDLLVEKKPLAVSLSTGTDSRVTLAASRAHSDKIHYFSYISDAAEEKDAFGAARLCQLLGIGHMIYRVPVEEMGVLTGTELSAILDHNSAYVRNPKPSERAKLHYLLEHFPMGMMEVKSPVSEIGRAIYCKKLGVDSLPERLTPRHMSNFYKRNMFDRPMLRFMDQAFLEYIETTAFGRDFYNYEQHDMFYWEHRNSAWASLANQDHDILHDMTVIFNNREVLKWLLSPPRKDRIADRLHHEIIRYLWPDVLQIPLSNTASPKHRLRKLAERIFFTINRV